MASKRVMLQVSIDEETQSVLSRLTGRTFKSLYVNEAIKSFAKSNEAKYFFKSSDFISEEYIENNYEVLAKEDKSKIEDKPIIQKEDKIIEEW